MSVWGFSELKTEATENCWLFIQCPDNSCYVHVSFIMCMSSHVSKVISHTDPMGIEDGLYYSWSCSCVQKLYLDNITIAMVRSSQVSRHKMYSFICDKHSTLCWCIIHRETYYLPSFFLSPRTISLFLTHCITWSRVEKIVWQNSTRWSIYSSSICSYITICVLSPHWYLPLLGWLTQWLITANISLLAYSTDHCLYH